MDIIVAIHSVKGATGHGCLYACHSLEEAITEAYDFFDSEFALPYVVNGEVVGVDCYNESILFEKVVLIGEKS